MARFRFTFNEYYAPNCPRSPHLYFVIGHR